MNCFARLDRLIDYWTIMIVASTTCLGRYRRRCGRRTLRRQPKNPTTFPLDWTWNDSARIAPVACPCSHPAAPSALPHRVPHPTARTVCRYPALWAWLAPLPAVRAAAATPTNSTTFPEARTTHTTSCRPPRMWLRLPAISTTFPKPFRAIRRFTTSPPLASTYNTHSTSSTRRTRKTSKTRRTSRIDWTRRIRTMSPSLHPQSNCNRIGAQPNCLWRWTRRWRRSVDSMRKWAAPWLISSACGVWAGPTSSRRSSSCASFGWERPCRSWWISPEVLSVTRVTWRAATIRWPSACRGSYGPCRTPTPSYRKRLTRGPICWRSTPGVSPTADPISWISSSPAARTSATTSDW